MEVPKGIQDKSGGGGIIRDENGLMKVAYGKSFGINTNSLAEYLALELGLEWCVTNGVTDLEVEFYSKLLGEWIHNSSTPPWNIWNSVGRIKALLNNQVLSWNAHHCVREVNKVADGLANWGMQFRDTNCDPLFLALNST
ncbi:uncharacterized protein LOC132060772 [Lycium ferocissimum]|uniref:uncharacterized protein LOC132060772 n=1 Tax=Lycium ferocissimum TaxID=112874 RepID=UPI002814EDD1|nr:uncharacterized protein LOC132060772 [Lycium ferocissimum]